MHFESVTIDFVRLLLEDGRYNRIVTMTDRLGSVDIQIKLYRMDIETISIILRTVHYTQSITAINSEHPHDS